MLQNIVDGELRRIDETFLRNPGLIPQQVFGVHDRISEHGMFVIRRVYCHHRQGGMITPSGGSGFTSKMLAMSISGSPLRSEDQSFGSWVPTFKPSLKSDQSVVEILGMQIIEDHSPFSMIHSTEHESLSLFDADLDPPRGIDPAANSLCSSIPAVTALLSRPERAEGTVFTVREIFALLVGAAHVALTHGDGLDPMFVEELLDLYLDLWTCCHVGSHPSLDDRLGVRRLDHSGGDLGRSLVVRPVESHCANGVLGALLWLAVWVGDRGRRSGLSGCDLLRKTTVLILPPAPTRTRIVAGDSLAIHSSPPT